MAVCSSDRAAPTATAVVALLVLLNAVCVDAQFIDCGDGGAGGFCSRWMCAQNNNRLCNIAKAIGDYTDNNCQQAQNVPAFGNAVSACNAEQTQNALSPNCSAVSPPSVGILYNDATCINPFNPGTPGFNSYIPEQLIAAGKENVYAESVALGRTTDAQIARSEAIFWEQRDSCNTVPGFTSDPPCVCSANVGPNPATSGPTADVLACQATIRNEILSQPPFLDEFAEVYRNNYRQQLITRAGFSIEAANIVAQESTNERFPSNTLPPLVEQSPAPAQHRRLRERRLVEQELNQRHINRAPAIHLVA